MPVYKSGQATRHEPCPHAASLTAWCNELLHVAFQDASQESVLRAKIELQDKYHEYRSFVGKDHRDRITERGHRCIWHVYLECYRQLRTYEIRSFNTTLKSSGPEQPDFIPLGEVIDGDADDPFAATGD